MYILCVSLVSLVLLLLIAWTKYKKEISKDIAVTGNQKAARHIKKKKSGFLTSEGLLDIFKDVIIVFFSAILALWLTGYVDNLNTKNKVESLLNGVWTSKTTQLANITTTLREIADGNTMGIYTNQERIAAAGAVLKSNTSSDVAILTNESVVSQLAPFTSLMLNSCQENLYLDIAYLQDELNQEVFDPQKVADYMASYCFFSYRMASYYEVLRFNANFDAVAFVLMDDDASKKTTYRILYDNDLENIEKIFGADVSAWKERKLTH